MVFVFRRVTFLTFVFCSNYDYEYNNKLCGDNKKNYYFNDLQSI